MNAFSPYEKSVYRRLLITGIGARRPNILLRAVKDGELEIAAKLIMSFSLCPAERKRLIDSTVDGYMNSSLHYASYYGHIEIVKLLLENGAEANVTNHVGNTPLHLACEANKQKSVECLLIAGAKWTIRNSQNKTPADVSGHYEHTEISGVLSALKSHVPAPTSNI